MRAFPLSLTGLEVNVRGILSRLSLATINRLKLQNHSIFKEIKKDRKRILDMVVRTGFVVDTYGEDIWTEKMGVADRFQIDVFGMSVPIPSGLADDMVRDVVWHVPNEGWGADRTRFLDISVHTKDGPRRMKVRVDFPFEADQVLDNTFPRLSDNRGEDPPVAYSYEVNKQVMEAAYRDFLLVDADRVKKEEAYALSGDSVPANDLMYWFQSFAPQRDHQVDELIKFLEVTSQKSLTINRLGAPGVAKNKAYQAVVVESGSTRHVALLRKEWFFSVFLDRGDITNEQIKGAGLFFQQVVNSGLRTSASWSAEMKTEQEQWLSKLYQELEAVAKGRSFSLFAPYLSPNFRGQKVIGSLIDVGKKQFSVVLKRKYSGAISSDIHSRYVFFDVSDVITTTPNDVKFRLIRSFPTASWDDFLDSQQFGAAAMSDTGTGSPIGQELETFFGRRFDVPENDVDSEEARFFDPASLKAPPVHKAWALLSKPLYDGVWKQDGTQAFVIARSKNAGSVLFGIPRKKGEESVLDISEVAMEPPVSNLPEFPEDCNPEFLGDVFNQLSSLVTFTSFQTALAMNLDSTTGETGPPEIPSLGLPDYPSAAHPRTYVTVADGNTFINLKGDDIVAIFYREDKTTAITQTLWVASSPDPGGFIVLGKNPVFNGGETHISQFSIKATVVGNVNDLYNKAVGILTGALDPSKIAANIQAVRDMLKAENDDMEAVAKTVSKEGAMTVATLAFADVKRVPPGVRRNKEPGAVQTLFSDPVWDVLRSSLDSEGFGFGVCDLDVKPDGSKKHYVFRSDTAKHYVLEKENPGTRIADFDRKELYHVLQKPGAEKFVQMSVAPVMKPLVLFDGDKVRP